MTDDAADDYVNAERMLDLWYGRGRRPLRHAARWGDPEGDPVGDVQRFVDQALADPSMTPNRVFVPERVFVRLKRGTMTKRRFRRWRGRWRAERNRA